MAFPAVQATNTSIEASAVTAHDVALPASISAGELLLTLLGSSDNYGTISAETGWTELLDVAGTVCLEKKIAAGSDANPQFDSSSSVTSAHNSYRISGIHGDVEVAFASSANPPSLTPSWGADDTLWIAGVIAKDLAGTVDVTAAPSSYSGLLKSASVTGGSGETFRMASAWRQLNAASEDPGTFTISAALDGTNRSFTMAIRPVPAAVAATKQHQYRQRRV